MVSLVRTWWWRGEGASISLTRRRRFTFTGLLPLWSAQRDGDLSAGRHKLGNTINKKPRRLMRPSCLFRELPGSCLYGHTKRISLLTLGGGPSQQPRRCHITFDTVNGPLHRLRHFFHSLADLRPCSGVMAERKSGDAHGGGGAPPRNAGPGRGRVWGAARPGRRAVCRQRADHWEEEGSVA